ncbi:hypothetical protein EBZ80_20460 [bacterium]|nr:hypothetical protein [bacterium]
MLMTFVVFVVRFVCEMCSVYKTQIDRSIMTHTLSIAPTHAVHDIYQQLRLENTGEIRTDATHAYPSALHALYIPFLRKRTDQIMCLALPDPAHMMEAFHRLDGQQLHDTVEQALTQWWTNVLNNHIHITLPESYIRQCTRLLQIDPPEHPPHSRFLETVFEHLGVQRVCFEVPYDPFHLFGISPVKDEPDVYEGWNLSGVVLRKLMQRRRPTRRDRTVIMQEWRRVQCILALKELFLDNFVDIRHLQGKSVMDLATDLALTSDDTDDPSLQKLYRRLAVWHRQDHPDHDLFAYEDVYPNNLVGFLVQKYLPTFLRNRQVFLEQEAFPHLLADLYPSRWRQTMQNSMDVLRDVRHQLRGLSDTERATLFHEGLDLLQHVQLRNVDVQAKVTRALAPQWADATVLARCVRFRPQYRNLTTDGGAERVWTPISERPPLKNLTHGKVDQLWSGFSVDARLDGVQRVDGYTYVYPHALLYVMTSLLHVSGAGDRKTTYESLIDHGMPQTYSLKQRVYPAFLKRQQQERLAVVLHDVVEQKPTLRRLLWTVPLLGWTDLHLSYPLDATLDRTLGAAYLSASIHAKTRHADEYRQWTWFLETLLPPTAKSEWPFTLLVHVFQQMERFVQQRQVWRTNVLIAVPAPMRGALDDVFPRVFTDATMPLRPAPTLDTVNEDVTTLPNVPWRSLSNDLLGKVLLGAWGRKVASMSVSEVETAVVTVADADAAWTDAAPMMARYQRWTTWWIGALTQVVNASDTAIDMAMLRGLLHTALVALRVSKDRVLASFDVIEAKLSSARDRRSKDAKVVDVVNSLVPADVRTNILERAPWDAAKEWRLSTLLLFAVRTTVMVASH